MFREVLQIHDRPTLQTRAKERNWKPNTVRALLKFTQRAGLDLNEEHRARWNGASPRFLELFGTRPGAIPGLLHREGETLEYLLGVFADVLDLPRDPSPVPSPSEQDLEPPRKRRRLSVQDRFAQIYSSPGGAEFLAQQFEVFENQDSAGKTTPAK